MTALALTVLGASLLGSLHCAGMCGGFVAFYAGDRRRAGARRARRHARLQPGPARRLRGARRARRARSAPRSTCRRRLARRPARGGRAGGALIVALGRGRAAREPRACACRASARRRRSAGSWPRHRPRSPRGRPRTRALVIGLLTGLLPCGWLYAFVVTAAGTGSRSRGAALMAVFWLGTLPVMAGPGRGRRRARGPAAPLRAGRVRGRHDRGRPPRRRRARAPAIRRPGVVPRDSRRRARHHDALAEERRRAAARRGARARTAASPCRAGWLDAGAPRQFCCAGCRAVYASSTSTASTRYYALRARRRGAGAREPDRPVATPSSTIPAFRRAPAGAAPDGLSATELYLEGVHCAPASGSWSGCRGLLPGRGRGAARPAALAGARALGSRARARCRRSRASSTRSATRRTRAAALRGRRRSAGARIARCSRASASPARWPATSWPSPSRSTAACSTAWSPSSPRSSAGRACSLALPSVIWGGGVFFRGAWTALRAARAQHGPADQRRAPRRLPPRRRQYGARGGRGLLRLGDGADLPAARRPLPPAPPAARRRRRRRAGRLALPELRAAARGRAARARCRSRRSCPARVVEVRAGDLVPADGVVVAGRSTVDVSLLSGESRPVAVAAGDRVHAGTLNVASRLEVRVETHRGGHAGRPAHEARRGARAAPRADRPARRPHLRPLRRRRARAGRRDVRPVGARGSRARARPRGGAAHRHLSLRARAGHAAGHERGHRPGGARGIPHQGRRRPREADAAGADVARQDRHAHRGARPRSCAGAATPSARPLVAAAEAHSSHPLARALLEALRRRAAPERPVEIVETHGGGIEAQVGERSVVVGSPAFVRVAREGGRARARGRGRRAHRRRAHARARGRRRPGRRRRRIRRPAARGRARRPSRACAGSAGASASCPATTPASSPPSGAGLGLEPDDVPRRRLARGQAATPSPRRSPRAPS